MPFEILATVPLACEPRVIRLAKRFDESRRSHTMSALPARYLPDRPFPAYAFVPGKTPRHAREKGEERRELSLAAALPPERWREDEDFLFGVDLYNAGFFWEAHEAWERTWRASRDERQRRLLQALIQLAAACLKLGMDEPAGAARLARVASDKLRALGEPELMGLVPAALARSLDACFAARPANPSGRPPLVLRTSAQSQGGSLA
jgi:hypothetical protein